MNEDPKPPDFDTSDLPPLEEPLDPAEFDSRDLEITPPEGRPVDKTLESIQLKEHGNAIAHLEKRVQLLEDQLDRQHHELQRLRKLLKVWLDGH